MSIEDDESAHKAREREEDLKSSWFRLCPSNDPRTADLSSISHAFIEGFPYEKQTEMMCEFIKAWRPVLDELPTGMSWFLPQHLGGMGLPLRGQKLKSSFSYLQLKLAAFLSASHSHSANLMAMSTISKSDSFSLWKKASDCLEKDLDTINYNNIEFLPYKSENDPTSHYLAGVVSDLSPSDVCCLESDKDERFKHWRDSFVKCWELAKNSTYVPDYTYKQISAARFYPHYPDLKVLNQAPTVTFGKPRGCRASLKRRVFDANEIIMGPRVKVARN